MEKVIEIRAKISYFDMVLNCDVDYNTLLNDVYKLVLGEDISEARARELVKNDVAYLVSIKRKVRK